MVSIGTKLNNDTYYCGVCDKKSRNCYLLDDGGVKCEACAMEYEQEQKAKARAKKIRDGWDESEEDGDTDAA